MAALVSCYINNLHVPLSCVLTYLGYRVMVMSVLPVNGSATLISGSTDAGSTVLDSSDQFRAIAAEAGRILNAKPHVVAGKTVPLACDVEGHMGLDGRYYMLDTARVMPPAWPSHPFYGCPHLYQLLRHEFVQTLPWSLSCDALSLMGSDNARVHNDEVKLATERLETMVIPALIESLHTKLSGADVILPAAIEDAAPGATPIGHTGDSGYSGDSSTQSDMQTVGSGAWLTQRLHEAGVNCRYLRKIWRQIAVPDERRVIATEIVARCVKHILNEQFRQVDPGSAERVFEETALLLLNRLLGDDALLWRDVLYQVSIRFAAGSAPSGKLSENIVAGTANAKSESLEPDVRYRQFDDTQAASGYSLMEDSALETAMEFEEDLDSTSIRDVDYCALFQRIQQLTGVHLTPTALGQVLPHCARLHCAIHGALAASATPVRPQLQLRDIAEIAVTKKQLRVVPFLRALETLGRTDDSVKLYECELAIRENALGRWHPQVAVTCTNLAKVFYLGGKFTQSVSMYLRAISIVTSHAVAVARGLKPSSADVLKSRDLAQLAFDLASCYSKFDDSSHTLQCCHVVLKIYESGTVEPGIRVIVEQLLALIDSEKASPLRMFTSEQAAQEAVEQVASLASELSNMLSQQRPDATTNDSRSDTNSSQRSLFSSHSGHSSDESNVAGVLYFLEQSLSMFARSEIPVAFLFKTITFIGGAFYYSSRFTACELAHKANIALLTGQIARLTHRGEHVPSELIQFLAEGTHYLALNDMKLNRLDAAEQHFLRALQLLDQIKDTADESIRGGVLHSFARLYVAIGQSEQAEPLLVQALAYRRRALGEAHPEIAKTLGAMGNLFICTGKYDQAEHYLSEGHQLAQRTLGAEHSTTARALRSLAQLNMKRGKYDAAQAQLQECLRIYSVAFGGDPRDEVASTLLDCARAHKALV
eukprot:TRINITY_DN4082_c0_g1_i1.p1 TRINITY_DN4082_c0_g1~~TRINITY_DN4082_c0_g1_i1.p1  ORF type:complete len:1070 (-),score=233.51 TRINITY_DN4082_c0_g1_i1:497-3301(-)